MDDKNLELIPDKDGFLFEIKDNIEITQHIMVLLVSFIGLVAMWLFGIGEGLALSKGDIYNRSSGTSILIVSSIYSIYKILKYNKEPHKILFYEHKITKISSNKEKSISAINEIYKRLIIVDIKGKVKRVDIFARLFLLLIFPIVFVGICLIYLSTVLFFRKLNYGYGLFLIGIDDFEIITILVEKDKEIAIENYFLKYHNLDIKKLKITWFIPEKN
ncbi:hypothetical protein [Aliarcobacter butzleri]|uniref:hypothetical protein n=1 Tax=Aliarcobacter butzleri TaxID=28197 RepID=UPI00214C60D1|nr:hypothetical protein [Aliarcobacter butzleri]MCP3648551.1 hypothetical protein [Arcobacter sp. DNRA7]MCR1814724.1 hypothetical protein [Aliarcobacter butzleri]